MATNLRMILLVLLTATGVLALGVEPARADPCSSSYGWFSGPGTPDHIPNCELQKQPTLTFDSSFSSGYAVYCGSDEDHMLFLGLGSWLLSKLHMGQFVLPREREFAL